MCIKFPSDSSAQVPDWMFETITEVSYEYTFAPSNADDEENEPDTGLANDQLLEFFD